MRIDEEKCIASGACVLACPEVFDQDDDGIVTVLIDRRWLSGASSGSEGGRWWGSSTFAR